MNQYPRNERTYENIWIIRQLLKNGKVSLVFPNEECAKNKMNTLSKLLNEVLT